MVPYKNRFSSSILATSVMTLFGYGYSFITGNNLKEPRLLGKLIRRGGPKGNKQSTRFSGWVVHYAVGLLFTEMYLEFWKNVPEDGRLKSGFMFGAIGGLAAILIWRLTFAFHPNPPTVNFSRFAINLFIGHILFGIVSAFTIACWDEGLPSSTRA
jgi:hypothetical protein